MKSPKRSILLGLICIGVIVLGGEARACTSGGDTREIDFTGQMYSCTIASSGTYSLYAIGANGGNQTIDDNPNPTAFGGKGAEAGATFALLAGDVLEILVGGVGGTQAPHILAGEFYAGGGGGGSFIALVRSGQPAVPLIVAGGGGGAGNGQSGLNGRGIEGSAGNGNGDGGHTGAGAGGTNGSGGGGSDKGAGGAGGGGFNGDGGNSPTATGGKSFLDGGAGGTAASAFCFGAAGGFGGGGGAAWSDCDDDEGAAGGGGGGYSGGGGGGVNFFGNDGGSGGGGSSFANPLFFVAGTVDVVPGYNPYADGNGVVFLQQLTNGPREVPEPSGLLLLASGVAGLYVGVRRRLT